MTNAVSFWVHALFRAACRKRELCKEFWKLKKYKLATIKKKEPAHFTVSSSSRTLKAVWVTLAHLSRQEFETGTKLWAVDGFSLLKSHSEGKLIWFSIIGLLWPHGRQWAIISYSLEALIPKVCMWEREPEGEWMQQHHEQVLKSWFWSGILYWLR